MAVGQWMRVLDAVGGVVELTQRFRRRPGDRTGLPEAARGAGALEARLAGVLVAALKEAFDRDSVRMELERAQVEGERLRAEQALRAELHRQAADRSLAHLRLVAVIAVCAWALSAVLGVWLPGTRELAPRVLLGAGWVLIFGALGCTFAGWREIVARSGDVPKHPISGQEPSIVPRNDRAEPPGVAWAPWLLLGALALIGASVLAAL
jgi:hypothetical protein